MFTINAVKTGKNIEKIRKEKGYSVKDIQNEFGFATTNTIYKWQKGESLPTIDNIFNLAKLFDITMEEIIITY